MPIGRPGTWPRGNRLDTGGMYDLKCRGAVLSVGDLVLVKQTAWRGRHKIQDRWESEEYQVIGQPTPGVPVYTVKRPVRGQDQGSAQEPSIALAWEDQAGR